MNKAGMLLGLIAGVVIGYNWPKVKKIAGPAIDATWSAASDVAIAGLRVLVEAKEDFEDGLAERKARQTPAETTTGVDAA